MRLRYPEFAAWVDECRRVFPGCALVRVQYIDQGREWRA
jgi:hypothetical protein